MNNRFQRLAFDLMTYLWFMHKYNIDKDTPLVYSSLPLTFSGPIYQYLQRIFALKSNTNFT